MSLSANEAGALIDAISKLTQSQERLEKKLDRALGAPQVGMEQALDALEKQHEVVREALCNAFDNSFIGIGKDYNTALPLEAVRDQFMRDVEKGRYRPSQMDEPKAIKIYRAYRAGLAVLAARREAGK